MGVQLIEHPMLGPEPVLQIRSDFAWCTDRFRAEMNAWLLERFGKREVAYFFGGIDGFFSQSLIMSPGALAKIINAAGQ